MKQPFTILSLALLGCILAFHLFLRMPMLEDSYCDPDVAASAYSAKNLLSGGVIYDQGVETKPPGSYILIALAFRLFGPSAVSIYLVSFFFHLVVIGCLFFLGRVILGNGAGLLAAFFYCLYSVSAGAAGHCPNFETWTLAPVALGFIFLWQHGRDDRRLWLFAAGICGGMAVLFKQTVAIIPVLAMALLWVNKKKMGDFSYRGKMFMRDLGASAAGALIPILLVLIFFASRNGLGPLWEALNPTKYMNYATSDSFFALKEMILKERIGFYLERSKVLLGLALLLPLFAAIRRRLVLDLSLVQGLRIIAIWVPGALFSTMSGTKFFDHYFMILCPPLCLMAGLSVWYLACHTSLGKLLGTGFVILVLGLTFNALKIEIRLAWEGYQALSTQGRLNWSEQSDLFYRKTDVPRLAAFSHRMRKTGWCIREKSSPEDPIYVWDYIPSVYLFADRRAPTRHFMYFDVATELPPGTGRWFDWANPQVQANRRELMDDLTVHPPKYIVQIRQRDPADTKWLYPQWHAPMFEELQEYLEANYEPDPDCSDHYILSWKRRAPNT